MRETFSKNYKTLILTSKDNIFKKIYKQKKIQQKDKNSGLKGLMLYCVHASISDRIFISFL